MAIEAPYLFQSARLGFRAWRASDTDGFAALCADPRVMEYFPRLLSRADAAASVARFRQHYADHGYGYFPVDELDSGSFIGIIGIQQIAFKAGFGPGVEIGWRLAA